VTDLFDDSALARIERQIDEWLGRAKTQNPLILAVDRSTDEEIRWYVRMSGEEKEFTTVWLTLGQRTLRFETYVMPAPEETRSNCMKTCCDETKTSRGTLFDRSGRRGVFAGRIALERTQRARTRPSNWHAVPDSRADLWLVDSYWFCQPIC